MDKQLYKTVPIKSDKFVAVINPDTQIKGANGILTWNTGIYGSKVDNAMPILLTDLYESGSPTHQNLINLKSNLILGNNLQAEDSKNDEVVNAFISKRNKAGANLKTVYGHCAKDFALMNACALQVIYNRNQQIAEVYSVPIQDVRLGTPNKFGQIENAYISKGWGIISNSVAERKKHSVRIKMFGADPKKYPTQLLYLKDYSYSYYAIPSYMSALNWIQIDREISNFHLNNTKANFWLSGILSQVKNGMSDEQIDENARTIESYFAGNTGKKVLLAYPETMADSPVFSAVNGTDQDKLFDVLSQQCFQAIITGHNAYPVLGGMDKSNNLGGDSDRLLTSISAFQQLTCEPYKKIILDGINWLLSINDIPPVICTTEPPKLTQAVQQDNDLTEAERRAMIFGLPPKDSSSNSVDNPNNIPS